MERFQSLINRLSLQAIANAPVAELLATTELLHCELLSHAGSAPVKINEAVAVWLPVGYNAAKQAADFSPDNNTTAEVPQPVSAPVFLEPVEAAVPVPPAPAPAPPAPPLVIKPIVPEPEPIIAQQAKVERVEPEKPLYFQLHITDEELEPEPVVIAKAPEPEPKPLQLPKPFPQYPDAETLMKNIFPLSASPAPTAAREVNQLVADPAMPLNEKLQEKKVEVGDVLAAGPRISDLRKAITINDKYQMISLLFRNDEDMFERSIRTLNNFGSLPEARFWMQRELVVKLGWNEEDTMVQHFYKLVSRRFA